MSKIDRIPSQDVRRVSLGEISNRRRRQYDASQTWRGKTETFVRGALGNCTVCATVSIGAHVLSCLVLPAYISSRLATLAYIDKSSLTDGLAFSLANTGLGNYAVPLFSQDLSDFSVKTILTAGINWGVWTLRYHYSPNDAVQELRKLGSEAVQLLPSETKEKATQLFKKTAEIFLPASSILHAAFNNGAVTATKRRLIIMKNNSIVLRGWNKASQIMDWFGKDIASAGGIVYYQPIKDMSRTIRWVNRGFVIGGVGLSILFNLGDFVQRRESYNQWYQSTSASDQLRFSQTVTRPAGGANLFLQYNAFEGQSCLTPRKPNQSFWSYWIDLSKETGNAISIGASSPFNGRLARAIHVSNQPKPQPV